MNQQRCFLWSVSHLFVLVVFCCFILAVQAGELLPYNQPSVSPVPQQQQQQRQQQQQQQQQQLLQEDYEELIKDFTNEVKTLSSKEKKELTNRFIKQLRRAQQEGNYEDAKVYKGLLSVLSNSSQD